MSATAVILLLWLAFAVTHMGLSSARFRPLLVERVGEGPFLGLYSAVSLVLFVPLVWFYLGHKHDGPILWSSPITPSMRPLFLVAVGVAMSLSILGLLQPSPASIAPGQMEVRGVARITRHPLFMGFGLVGLLHMIPNGAASDLAFFGGLPLFAIVGCRHQDRRKLAAGLPGYRQYVDATPFLPFTAVGTLRGLREVGPLRLGIAIAGSVLIRWFHPTLFG